MEDVQKSMSAVTYTYTHTLACLISLHRIHAKFRIECWDSWEQLSHCPYLRTLINGSYRLFSSTALNRLFLVPID